MLNERSPETANTVVTLTEWIKSVEAGVAAAEPCGPARKGVSRAALYLAHIDTPRRETPPTPPPVPERRVKTFWSQALDFVVEGFANCGSLYPVAHLHPGDALPAADASPRKAVAANERRNVLSLVPHVGQGIADVDQRIDDLGPESVALTSQEIEQPRRWNWLQSCWEFVLARHSHMRREQAIRQAVEALAELDDGTLKDIGIHHRSHIEYAVRNGNGC